jgi:hypothetical protein
LTSNDIFASTSVDTLPGTIFKISHPNCTSRSSSVASTCSSMFFPCFLPYSHAASISFAYSGFFDAARMRDGLVVASWGLYFPIVAKSPESQTTVYIAQCVVSMDVFTLPETPNGLRQSMDAAKLTVPVALSWSREEDMIVGSSNRLFN